MILLLLLFPLQNVSAREFQFWVRNITTQKLSPKWTLENQFAARFRDSARRIFFYYGEWNIARELPSDWKFVIGYRHLLVRVIANDWRTIPFPHFSLTKTIKQKGFTFSNRNRLEYLFNIKTWRYRNRIEFRLPFYFTCWKLRPFVSNEFFIQEGRSFNQNRLQIGIKKGVASVSYQWRADRVLMQWISTDVLYLTLKWSF